MEGLEFVTVSGGGSGHDGNTGSGAGPVARGPGLRARAGTLPEARGFPEAGRGGHGAQRGVTHPSGGSRYPGARLSPPRAQWLPLGVLGSWANIWEAVLRGWGWQQGTGALGGKGVGPGHVGEGWLPGRGHWGWWVSRWVRQGILKPSGLRGVGLHVGVILVIVLIVCMGGAGGESQTGPGPVSEQCSMPGAESRRQGASTHWEDCESRPCC